MARKELSDALRHEFFRSGSVLRSTFFTILSLLLAVMLLFQIWLYHNAYQRLLGSARESGEAFLTLAAKLSDENFGRLCDAAKQLTWNDEVLYAALFPDTQDRPRNFRIVTELKSFAADTRYVTDVILLCNRDGSAYSSGGDVGLLAELPTAEDFSAQALGPAGASSATLVRTASGTLCLRYPFIPCSYGYLGELLLYLDAEALFSSLCSRVEPLAVYAPDGSLLYSNLDTPLKAGSRNTLVGMSAATGLTFCHSYTTVTLHLGEYLASNHLLLVMVILLAVLVLAALLVAWLFYRPLRKTLQTLRSSDEALPKNESVSDWDLLNRSVLALSRDTVQFRKIIQIISPYVLRQLLCELVDGAELDADSVRQTLASLPDTLPCEGTFLLFVTSNRVTGVLNPAAIEHMPHPVELEEFRRVLLDSILAQQPGEEYVFTEEDKSQIARLREQRYATWEWNYGQSRECEMIRQKRFPACGGVEAHLSTDRGVIRHIAFTGDFFSVVEPEVLAEKLVGVRLEEQSLRDALAQEDAGRYFSGLKNEELIELLLS